MANHTLLCGFMNEKGGIDASALTAMESPFKSQLTTHQATTTRFGVAAYDISNSHSVIAAITGFPLYKQANAAQSHADQLASIYQIHGENLFAELGGQFAFALYDEAKNRLILGLDKIGVHQLYYLQTSEGLIFGSAASAILRHPSASRELSPQGLFNYFYFNSTPSPGTVFRGMRKLVGGQYLVYENSKVNVKTYWKPSFSESTSHSVEELGVEMLDIIGRSVENYCDEPSIGAFLSGGLDSSTVSGMLAKVRPGSANTFSIGFDAKGYDEMEYARIASKHFGTQQHEYYVTPDDVLSMVDNIAAAYDEPFGNSSALPAYFCAKMAKEHGVTRLLAGDGGDEIFAGNERYAKQGVFEHYSKLPSLLKSVLLEPLLLHNPLAKHLPLIKKARSYIIQAKTPLPDRLESYNHLHRHAAEEIFSSDFLAQIDRDEPLRLLREAYNGVPGATPLNKMMLLDWKRTLHDNDLVKVNRMCELAGVEVAYPLLSDELIDFSCRIPSGLKLKNGQLRWFYKNAVKNFLPDEIINKQKHGFGLPFGIWTSTHQGLKDYSYAALHALKKRDIFRPEFIENTIKMHQSVHAKYYGELVWVLMMLELWLASH